MGRYCKVCGRKFKFLETEYDDGICEECYKIKLHEEAEKERLEELNRKRKEEEKLEAERKKKIQEKLELERKKKIEEQKRNSILEFLKDKFSNKFMYILFNIFSNDSKKYIEKYLKLTDKYQQNDNSLLVEILVQYLSKLQFFEGDTHDNSFSIDDVKKVFENEKILYDIVKKYVKSPDDEVYYELFNIDDDEFSKDFLKELRKSIDSPNTLYELKRIIRQFLQLCNDTNIEKYIYSLTLMDELTEEQYFLAIDIKNKIMELSDDEGVISNYMYLWLEILYPYCLAYILCYLMALSQHVSEIHPELETIYEQLIKKRLKITYITNQIYEMYDSLYTDMSPTILKKGELGIILWFKYYNKTNASSNMEEIVKEYKRYKEKYNDIENEKSTSRAIYDLLSKIYIIDIIPGESKEEKEDNNFYIVNNLLYNLTGELTAKEFFYNSFHCEQYYEAIEINKKNEKKEKMKKERDRYLSGNFDKEDKMIEEEYSFENIQNGYEFEEYVANLYKKLGYTIEEVTKKSGDQGADVIANKDGKRYVIQAKYYNSPVGNKAVQEVVASIKIYGANQAIVVTNNNFTSSAIELAKANNVELINGDKLKELKQEVTNTIKDEPSELFVYVQNILKRVEENLNIEDIENNEHWLEDIFMSIGESYVVEENFINYTDNNKIERLINTFFKRGKLNIGNITLDLKENKEVYANYIRMGIFKLEVLEKINEIINNATSEEEKNEKITEFINSYINEETNEDNKLAKIMVIQKVLDIDLLGDI